MTLDELPYDHIFFGDYEFFPGKGLANGSRNGDAPTPLCGVIREWRSGQVWRLWQDELLAAPLPYLLDNEHSVFIGFMLTAEYGVHAALGLREPRHAIDLFIEFKHLTNDGSIRSGDGRREKGFHSLAGCLNYFKENGIDTAHKDAMRDRIIQGPPFSADERRRILAYNEEDTDATVVAARHLISTIRSLPHAEFRARYAWTVAQHEHRGLPIDPQIEELRPEWNPIRAGIVRERDAHGLYEVDEAGVPHWRAARWAEFVRGRGMAWPLTARGDLDLQDKTFKEMGGRYPFINEIRELRATLSKLRLNDLRIGRDLRNRCVLGPYSTKTARNAPRAAHFIFAGPKWVRSLIVPPPGRALVHRDFAQQEVRIAAVRSRDMELLRATEEGDVYIGIARMLGFAPEDATPASHPEVRNLFKVVVLAIMYGLGARSLALLTGLTLVESGEILERLKARFHVFEDWAADVLDRAGVDLEISTPFGWTMWCPPGIGARTVRNYPVQSTASEVLHVASILAERRNLEVVATVHDSITVECDLAAVHDASVALDRVMGDAAATVLHGYRLPTDAMLIGAGLQYPRYFDKRGIGMWSTVTRLLEQSRARSA